MKPFEMIIVPEAQEDIKRLDPKIRTRVFDKLEWIEQNARLIRHQPLQGSQWAECYKYRIGDYRVIYLLDEPHNKLTILKVRHRREVYE